jgi:hypothetical protein|tara:strand:+ start:1991 stop:2167 length:177 start_codon:yes stop_codon:yes gene_type:complete
MTIRVKIMLTIDIDTEEYAVPADGKVDDEIEDFVREALYDLEGTKIKNFRITSEEIHK